METHGIWVTMRHKLINKYHPIEHMKLTESGHRTPSMFCLTDLNRFKVCLHLRPRTLNCLYMVTAICLQWLSFNTYLVISFYLKPIKLFKQLLSFETVFLFIFSSWTMASCFLWQIVWAQRYFLIHRQETKAITFILCMQFLSTKHLCTRVYLWTYASTVNAVAFHDCFAAIFSHVHS